MGEMASLIRWHEKVMYSLGISEVAGSPQKNSTKNLEMKQKIIQINAMEK